MIRRAFRFLPRLNTAAVAFAMAALMSLPLELLSTIVSYLVLSYQEPSQPSDLYFEAWKLLPQAHPRLDVEMFKNLQPLLLTCRLLYSLSRPILYRNLSFIGYGTTNQRLFLNFLESHLLDKLLLKSLSIKLSPSTLMATTTLRFFPFLSDNFPQLESLQLDQYYRISSLSNWPSVQPLQVKRLALTNCFARQAELSNLIRGFSSL